MIVWTCVMTYDLGVPPRLQTPCNNSDPVFPRSSERLARPGDLVLAFNGSLVQPVNGNELHQHSADDHRVAE